jgi:diguanylate cyclase (GGDEF)-like protein
MMDHRRHRGDLTLLVVDIDHFKRVNDRFGHAAGDAVIRKVGEILRDCVTAADKVARFGGEEFVVLLRAIGTGEAGSIAERMRAAVEAMAVPRAGQDIGVTVSIGAATASAADTDLEAIIERADKALYDAKSRGRNCVRLSQTSDGRDLGQAA